MAALYFLPVSLSYTDWFSESVQHWLYKNKLHRLTEQDSRLVHYVGLFWGSGLIFGYLATSSGKSDIIFLLSDPDFL